MFEICLNFRHMCKVVNIYPLLSFQLFLSVRINLITILKRSNIMKNTIIASAFLLFLASPAFAKQPPLIKSCSTIIPALDNSPETEYTFKVYVIDKSLSSRLTQKDDKYFKSSQIDTFVSTEKVREGINENINDGDNLNPTEALIQRALILTKRSKFKNVLSAGLDLKKVRSATVFTTILGSVRLPVIVEAKDESGRDLGSFLIRNFVTPCE